MNHLVRLRAVAWLAAVLALTTTLPVAAQDDAPGDAKPAATTTADPKIPVDRLQIHVGPMTQDELAVEADGWVGLLRAKAQAIADAQLASGDAAAGSLADLRLEQSALIERAGVVLDEWERKGGDATGTRQYVDALSGIAAGVADSSEAGSMIEGWLTSPEGGIRLAKALAKAAVIFIAFWIVARILGRLTRAAMNRSTNLSELMRNFVERWVRRIVLIVGVIVALGALGVNVGPLMAAIGALGLVVGLALQGTLSNFASGILILANRPFDVGDVINAAGVVGKVNNVSLFSTTLISADNQRTIVPNNAIWGGVITNITGLPTRRVDLVFGIGYDDDIAKAQKILEEIVTEHELVLDDPAPVIKVHELADSSVNFVCRPWSKTSDYWDVYWDLHRRVKERFDAEGVSIPYPQQDVHMHQVESKSD